MARKTTRRGKGESSVFQRGDERWVAQLFIGYDGNGRPDYLQKSAKTQKEAIEKLEVLKRAQHSGVVLTDKTTLKDYLTVWLSTQRHLEPNTLQEYTRMAKYLNGYLGAVRLNKLGTQQIKIALGKIQDDSAVNATKQNKGVVPSNAGVRTANLARTVLKKALEDAVNDTTPIITRNPVNFKPFKTTKKEIVIWSETQMKEFLGVAKDSTLYSLFVLGVGTGLRLGELAGLRWKDVTLNAVSVQQALKVVNNRLQFGSPKTPNSRRRVAISPEVVSALDVHREKQSAQKKDFGAAYEDNGLVFATELGKPLHLRNIERAFYALQKRVRKTLPDLPHSGMHGLRHFHASLCIHNGMNVRMLADRLGHTDVTLTLRTYTHVFEDHQGVAAPDMSGLFTPKAVPNYAN